ncbi:hypothetical protein CPB83DRAFT_858756 [Crepidotus variabilis]|uniref:Uncharacterized protein n=1 Tax=Crepidotus variabilis TaxID=179855 RepID=A0A9P6EB48_9AGAR|nr:hypothetical protein CPB83DRAFT_858756 [Crepidotus variabilis]
MSDARRCIHGLKERWRCWSAILAACGVAMPGAAHVSEDVSVTLTRIQKRSEVVELENLQRTATSMLSCWIPRTYRSAKEEILHESNATTSGYAPSSTESTSDASSESFVTLDYPLDAYITPGTGKRVDCKFPVVCAGDEDDIQDLVTSIVCQRHVWGLTTTVVGISLPKKGTHASLIIGWLETKDFASDASPIVHVAIPLQPTSADLPLGVFDASDAESALHFAQFILDLQPLFSTVKSGLHTPNLKDFCWKAEHIHFHDQISKPEPSFSVHLRVAAWLKTLPYLETADAGSFPLDNDLLPVMSGRKKTPTTSQSSSQYLEVPRAGKKDATSQTRYSCSTFGKKDDNDAQGIRTYLADRRTIPLLLLKRETRYLRLAIEEQINDFYDVYEKHTSFIWPTEWKSLAALPPCDKALERFRADLFTKFKVYKEQKQPISYVNTNDSAISVIAYRMSTCMNIVAQAELTRFNTLDGIIIESGTRVAWDQGMKSGCCVDPNEPLSRAFYVERLMRLAVNQAAFEGPKFNFTDHTDLASQLAVNQLFAAQATGLRALITLARGETALTLKHLEDRTQPITLGDRAYEPYQAIVDGAYCLHYDPATRASIPPRKHVAEAPSQAPWFTVFRKFFHSGEPTSNEECKHHSGNPDAHVTQQSPKAEEDDKTSPCLCSEATRSMYEASSSPITTQGNQQLLIPFILNEYKRNSDAIHQAFNQVRMYCVSAVEFLASIGITDYPVWGVVAAGNEGAITMAWKSTSSWTDPAGSSKVQTRGQASGPRTNFIFDRNVKKFDLSDPLQAYHFLTCIHRIHRLEDRLRAKLDSLNIRKKLECENYENWMSAIPPKEDKTDAKKK